MQKDPGEEKVDGEATAPGPETASVAATEFPSQREIEGAGALVD